MYMHLCIRSVYIYILEVYIYIYMKVSKDHVYTCHSTLFSILLPIDSRPSSVKTVVCQLFTFFTIFFHSLFPPPLPLFLIFSRDISGYPVVL